MQLSYRGIRLDTLGAIEHAGVRYAGVPDTDGQQRRRVSWKLTFHFTQDTWSANWLARDGRLATNAADSVMKALSTPDGVLIWKDDAGNSLLPDGTTACAEDIEWPDEGGGGYRHQTLSVTFVWYEHNLDNTGKLAATYQPTGDPSPLTLGNVYGATEGYTAERYSPLRDQRSRSVGNLSLRGEFLADLSQALDVRKSSLLSVKNEWMAKLTGTSSGKLIYGTGASKFEKTVRITRFTCDVNQAATAIGWNLEAEFTRWPNEAGYALAEYSLREAQNTEDGTTRLAVSGTIGAQTDAAALTKLGDLLTAVAATYTAASKNLTELDREQTLNRVAADEDGETFTSLTFTVNYRVGQDATIAARHYTASDEEDPRNGLIRRRVRGTLTAHAATWDAAYAAAWTEAKSLGAGKSALLLGGTITVTDSRQKGGYSGSATGFSVTVEFEFSYQLKGEKIAFELTSSRTVETFGSDREEVSGHILAPTPAAAKTLWDTLRAGYAGLLIEGERFGEAREYQTQSAAPGTRYSPPFSDAFSPASDVVNSGEKTASDTEGVADTRLTVPPMIAGSYVRHWRRFEFALTAFRPKTPGTCALRYDVAIGVNYLSREKRTVVSGRAYAATTADVETALGLLNLTGYGRLTENKRTQERVKDFGLLTDPTPSDNRPLTSAESESPPGYLTAVSFELNYTDDLSDADALIECSETEDVQHTGVHWVLTPTAFGRPIAQGCGYTPGQRTVRATAVATTEALAREFVEDVLTNRDWFGFTRPATTYLQPPRFTSRPTYGPLIYGYWNGREAAGTASGRLFEVSGERTELFTEFDFQPQYTFEDRGTVTVPNPEYTLEDYGAV